MRCFGKYESSIHTPRRPPLADITTWTVNERPRMAMTDDETVKLVRPVETPMQRPMDIVLESHTTAITYLIPDNFTSYAGRQEVGPFHASFSSVVGPNGSDNK